VMMALATVVCFLSLFMVLSVDGFDSCTFLPDCGTCVAQAGCGWCEGGVGQCLGVAQGPSNCKYLTSSSTTYYTSATQCNAQTLPDCFAKFPNDSIATCDDCLNDTQCGWCNVPGPGGTCRGKLFQVACTTPGGTWSRITENFRCPAPNLCKYYNDCLSCNSAIEGCGWCDSPAPIKCLESTGAAFCEGTLAGFGGYWNSTCGVPPHCPITNSPPEPANITYCSEYASSACCNSYSDGQLQANTTAKVIPLLGSGGCYENLKAMFCGWNCDTVAGSFVQYTPATVDNNNIATTDVWISQSFADAFFQSCLKVCEPFEGGTLIEQMYADSTAFVESFDSSNDPTYHPNAEYPVLIFHVGTAPIAKGSFLHTTQPPSASDLLGCPGKASSAVSLRQLTTVTFVAVIFGLFVVVEQ